MLEETVATLAPIIHRYAKERLPGERFGNFCDRTVLAEKPATPEAAAPAA